MGNTRDVVWKYYFVDRKCELASNARERSRQRRANATRKFRPEVNPEVKQLEGREGREGQEGLVRQ
jgi:hypothetical protein